MGARGLSDKPRLYPDYFLKKHLGGFSRLPLRNPTEFEGQTFKQDEHVKQSGITFSCFNIAPMTVEGQAFAQD